MQDTHYDINAPKKATNLSINADLLARARSLEINLSRVLEERLSELVREAGREQWLTENRAALDEYNARIDQRGSFGDSARRF